VGITIPRPLYPQERPGTPCGGGWAKSRAGIEGYGKSRLTGIRSPDQRARSESPHRLQYPGPLYGELCFGASISTYSRPEMWEDSLISRGTVETLFIFKISVGVRRPKQWSMGDPPSKLHTLSVMLAASIF
jgi:hypothetical protein